MANARDETVIKLPNGQQIVVQGITNQDGQQVINIPAAVLHPGGVNHNVDASDNQQNIVFVIGSNGSGTDVPIQPTAEDEDEDQPFYVNNKQYNRILKRRQQRAQLERMGILQKGRQKYMHESRHHHAMMRVRSSSGKFAAGKRYSEPLILDEMHPHNLMCDMKAAMSQQQHQQLVATTSMPPPSLRHHHPQQHHGASTSELPDLIATSLDHLEPCHSAFRSDGRIM